VTLHWRRSAALDCSDIALEEEGGLDCSDIALEEKGGFGLQ